MMLNLREACARAFRSMQWFVGRFMERLTEYEWEQRKRDRAAYVEHLLVCAQLAEHDRKHFDVEYESATWKQWRQIRSKREADGWQLAEYGQSGSMFLMSGYFKLAKASPPNTEVSGGKTKKTLYTKETNEEAGQPSAAPDGSADCSRNETYS